MAKPPAILIEWRNSTIDIKRAKQEGRNPLRIARIRCRIPITGVADEQGKQRFHRMNETIGLSTVARAEKVKKDCELTLQRIFIDGQIEPPPANLTSKQLLEYLVSGGKCFDTIKLSTDSLERVITAYLDSQPAKQASSLATEKVHHRWLKRILRGSTPFASVSSADMVRYKNERLKKVCADTVQREFASFRELWKHAREVLKIVSGESPTKGVGLQLGGDKLPFKPIGDIEKEIAAGLIPQDEQESVWASAFLLEPDLWEILALVKNSKQAKQTPWLYPAFALCALTGCRRLEMLDSRRVDIRGGFIVIREMKRKKKQAGSFRTVPLRAELVEILTNWFATQPGSPYTICDKQGKPISQQVAGKAFRRVVKGTRFENLRGYHVFRHSIISIAAMQGKPQSIIDAWVGHTSKIRERYIHLIPSISQATMDSLLLTDLFKGGESVGK